LAYFTRGVIEIDQMDFTEDVDGDEEVFVGKCPINPYWVLTGF